MFINFQGLQGLPGVKGYRGPSVRIHYSNLMNLFIKVIFIWLDHKHTLICCKPMDVGLLKKTEYFSNNIVKAAVIENYVTPFDQSECRI